MKKDPVKRNSFSTGKLNRIGLFSTQLSLRSECIILSNRSYCDNFLQNKLFGDCKTNLIIPLNCLNRFVAKVISFFFFGIFSRVLSWWFFFTKGADLTQLSNFLDGTLSHIRSSDPTSTTIPAPGTPVRIGSWRSSNALLFLLEGLSRMSSIEECSRIRNHRQRTIPFRLRATLSGERTCHYFFSFISSSFYR